MPTIEPLRSEVWTIDFGIAAKVRPALVLSRPYTDEDRALIAVVPHTTALRGSSYEIQLQTPFLRKEGAFLIQGFSTVPPRHFIRRLGSLSDEQMDLIADGLRIWLGL